MTSAMEWPECRNPVAGGYASSTTGHRHHLPPHTPRGQKKTHPRDDPIPVAALGRSRRPPTTLLDRHQSARGGTVDHGTSTATFLPGRVTSARWGHRGEVGLVPLCSGFTIAPVRPGAVMAPGLAAPVAQPNRRRGTNTSTHLSQQQIIEWLFSIFGSKKASKRLVHAWSEQRRKRLRRVRRAPAGPGTELSNTARLHNCVSAVQSSFKRKTPYMGGFLSPVPFSLFFFRCLLLNGRSSIPLLLAIFDFLPWLFNKTVLTLYASLYLLSTDTHKQTLRDGLLRCDIFRMKIQRLTLSAIVGWTFLVNQPIRSSPWPLPEPMFGLGSSAGKGLKATDSALNAAQVFDAGSDTSRVLTKTDAAMTSANQAGTAANPLAKMRDTPPPAAPNPVQPHPAPHGDPSPPGTTPVKTEPITPHPTDPPTTHPADPPTTNPTDPPTTHPADPSTTSPTDPPATHPTDPPTTHPTDPPTTHPTDPPTTHPTDPPTTHPTDPPTTHPGPAEAAKTGAEVGATEAAKQAPLWKKIAKAPLIPVVLLFKVISKPFIWMKNFLHANSMLAEEARLAALERAQKKSLLAKTLERMGMNRRVWDTSMQNKLRITQVKPEDRAYNVYWNAIKKSWNNRFPGKKAASPPALQPDLRRTQSLPTPTPGRVATEGGIPTPVLQRSTRMAGSFLPRTLVPSCTCIHPILPSPVRFILGAEGATSQYANL
ncbi:hypothetical protein VP01_3303g1 [Puccinia sorghi]|uniref:Uncharacterized protein n=1 Tax=Puccinia sorghi TaxID=27349 RepID=A0A0L6UXC6_9BASI|nr:hypothetical protein VP01_3303g1 [Puccinia sorghi]